MAPAGFWKRYAAWTLDAAVLLPLTYLLTAPQLAVMCATTATAAQDLFHDVAAAMARMLAQGGDPLATAFALVHDPALLQGSRAIAAAIAHGLQPALIAFTLLVGCYHTVFEQTSWRGTPGKRLLGIVVADRTGAAPTLSLSLLRNGAGLLSWLSMNLGHALIALPPEHRALHDRIAGAQVLAPSATLPHWARAWLLAQAVLLIVLLACASAWAERALDDAILRALG